MSSRCRLTLAVALTLSGTIGLTAGTASAAIEPRDIDIGGRVMHLTCVGTPTPGQPTVIAEAGYGGTSGDFVQVLALLEESSIHACAYDRAGLGLSEARTEPSDLADGADDLHALVEAAGIEPPYVLLPHSMGAWYARYFTDRYPDEVVGVAFIDPTHPDLDARFLAMLPPPSDGEDRAIASMRAEGPPDPLLDQEAMVTQVHSVGDLGDRPVVVLTQDWMTEPIGLPEPYEDRFAQAWLAMSMEQASLSTHGAQRVVPGSGHYIQLDHPEAVVEAVQEVLATVDAQRDPA
jgi:pimeloyl-ACP methyl ester carboxylesterase